MKPSVRRAIKCASRENIIGDHLRKKVFAQTQSGGDNLDFYFLDLDISRFGASKTSDITYHSGLVCEIGENK